MASEPSRVFISYSHRDKAFLDQLLAHMRPLADLGISTWSDRQIQPGSKWLPEIQLALRSAKVAILLVTKDFLASDFIQTHELGPLLKTAENGGARILWVLVRACYWKGTPLKDYQAVILPDKPLAEMKAERDTAWVRICEAIRAAVSLATAAETEQPSKAAHSKEGSDGSHETRSPSAGDELFTLSEQYFNALMSHYLPYLRVMEGDLTYNQALELTIEHAKTALDFQRLDTLVNLHFGELRPSLDQVLSARDRANELLDAHKAAYKRGDLDGHKYIQPLKTILGEMARVTQHFRQQATRVITATQHPTS